MKKSIISWLLHGAVALLIQAAWGFGTGDWKTGGAFAVGAFVGIEWMQQIRVNLQAENRPWPTPLSLKDVLKGLYWTKLDRYGDCGVPLLLCYGVYHLTGG